MKEKLLTNDQIAEAYGGYDFKTAEMKAVCRAQRELDLALFREEIEKAGIVPSAKFSDRRPAAEAQLAYILSLLQGDND